MRYIDTNIILRFFTEEKPSKKLIDFFERLQKGEERVKCLDMVFFQVIFVLKSYYKAEKCEIVKGMKELLYFKGLRVRDRQTLERTLELWETHPDDIIDCYIVANMEKEDEREIYSFDKKISRLGVKPIVI